MFLRSCNVKISKPDIVHTMAMEHRLKICAPGPSKCISRIWNLPTFNVPDSPMLAHGIIAIIMHVLHPIFACFGKFTAFVKFANPLRDDVRSQGEKLSPYENWRNKGERPFKRLTLILQPVLQHIFIIALRIWNTTNLFEIKATCCRTWGGCGSHPKSTLKARSNKVCNATAIHIGPNKRVRNTLPGGIRTRYRTYL